MCMILCVAGQGKRRDGIVDLEQILPAIRWQIILVFAERVLDLSFPPFGRSFHYELHI